MDTLFQLINSVLKSICAVQVDERACQQVLRTKHLLTMSEERPEPPGPFQEPPRTPFFSAVSYSAVVQHKTNIGILWNRLYKGWTATHPGLTGQLTLESKRQQRCSFLFAQSNVYCISYISTHAKSRRS